jgi:hypothetical protein
MDSVVGVLDGSCTKCNGTEVIDCYAATCEPANHTFEDGVGCTGGIPCLYLISLYHLICLCGVCSTPAVIDIPLTAPPEGAGIDLLGHSYTRTTAIHHLSLVLLAHSLAFSRTLALWSYVHPSVVSRSDCPSPSHLGAAVQGPKIRVQLLYSACLQFVLA